MRADAPEGGRLCLRPSQAISDVHLEGRFVGPDNRLIGRHENDVIGQPGDDLLKMPLLSSNVPILGAAQLSHNNLSFL